MTPKPTGGCTPTPGPEEELRKKIEKLDIDFGYAVGNLGEDCKDDTVERIMQLIRTEVLKARMDESQYWQSRIIDITKGFVSADFAKESGYDHLKKLSDQLQANQEKK